MKKVTNLQLSMFGTFESLSFDSSFISKIIPLYGDKLIPSFINIATFDTIKQSLQNYKRLSMISPNEEFNIVFLPDRIDCNYTAKDAAGDSKQIEHIFSEMCSLLQISLNSINAMGNRLAMNGRYIPINAISHKKYINPVEFYLNKSIIEWGMNCNAITDIEINGRNESINNIINISVVPDTPDGVKQAFIVFDINTSTINTLPRFSSKDLKEFLDKAMTNMKQIISNVG